MINCVHLLCTLTAAHTLQSSHLALCPLGKSSPLDKRECRLDQAHGKWQDREIHTGCRLCLWGILKGMSRKKILKIYTVCLSYCQKHNSMFRISTIPAQAETFIMENDFQKSSCYHDILVHFYKRTTVQPRLSELCYLNLARTAQYQTILPYLAYPNSQLSEHFHPVPAGSDNRSDYRQFRLY